MEYLAPKRGAVVEGGPTNSTDDGFDTWLRRLKDQALICVQCKRLTEQRLGAAAVAIELAKVGMRAALEGSTIREHYFVTTGGVTKELPRLQREDGWATLRAKAVSSALRHEDFDTLRASLASRNLDVATIVGDYIDGLDALLVWSGRQYEEQLTSVWSKLSDIVERHFKLDVAIRERPRPDLDTEKYVRDLARTPQGEWLELRTSRCALPEGVRTSAGDNPLRKPTRHTDDARVTNAAPGDVIEAVLTELPGTCTFVVAPGGGGKSTTSQMAVARAAAACVAGKEGPVPIGLSLGSYRGDLTKMVHAVLGITHGHWTSLSGPFLLVGDGLDEVPPQHIQTLIDEIESVMQHQEVACILTLRNGGLRRPVVIRTAGSCWAAQPLTIRQIHRLAEHRLGSDRAAQFLQKLRPRLKRFGAAIFALPFGAAAALHAYEESGQLPETTTALLHLVTEARITRNATRLGLPDALRDTPLSLIRALVREVAFEFRVVRQLATLDRCEAEAAVASALSRLKQQAMFGAGTLSDVDAWTLCAHYEFLIVREDSVAAGHDLVADYLAGQLLHQRWNRHLSHLGNVIAQDAWVFAAANVPEEETPPFIHAVRESDLILAARCAVESGAVATRALEPHCIRAIDGEDLFSIASGIVGAGILGTDALIAKLRWCVAAGSQEQRDRATQTLATVGDTGLLEATLVSADPPASDEYVQISGGEIATWHRAPGQIAVELARKRLEACAIDAPVVLSIQTVHTYGESTDFELVQRFFSPAAQGKVYSAAVWCMHALNPSRTKALLSERVGSTITLDTLREAHLLHLTGGVVAVSRDSLENLLVGLEPRTPRGHELMRVLGELPFDSSGATHLRSMLDDGTIESDTAWQLAADHGLPEFDDLAWQALGASAGTAYGHAARFAVNRGWGDEEFQRFATEALLRAAELTTDMVAGRWHFERILDLCLEAGMKKEVAKLLTLRLPIWIDRHISVVADERARRGMAESRPPRAKAEDFYFRISLPQLVPYAAAVARHLPRSLLRQCVHISVAHSSDESRAAYGRLARVLDPEELDEELERIGDPDERLTALSIVAVHSGATDRRVALLVALLPDSFNVPMRDHHLSHAVQSLWCDDVASSLINTIATGEWDPRYGFEFARSTTGIVVERLSAGLVERLITPAIARARTVAARELLEFWASVGRRRQSAATVD